jgi:hypothetical protein
LAPQQIAMICPEGAAPGMLLEVPVGINPIVVFVYQPPNMLGDLV